jgi:hypothetical protein
VPPARRGVFPPEAKDRVRRQSDRLILISWTMHHIPSKLIFSNSLAHNHNPRVPDNISRSHGVDSMVTGKPGPDFWMYCLKIRQIAKSLVSA